MRILADHEKIKIIVPKFASIDDIQSLLESKSSWVYQRALKIVEHKEQNSDYYSLKDNLLSGVKIPLFGEKTIIKCNYLTPIKKPYGRLCDDSILLFFPENYIYENDKVKKFFVVYLQDCLSQVIKNYIDFYSTALRVKCKSFIIKKQKTLWGSCSIDAKLNFNLALVLAPEKIIKYLVLHEMSHILQHNHSKKFWNIVKEQMQDYEDCEKWLSKNAWLLSYFR